jgi:hypothetical protein
MEENIFTRQQEQQILDALDDIDKDLGIDRLNDETSLRGIFQRYPDRVSSTRGKERSGWLDGLGLGWVVKIGSSLASPVYVYASFVLILSLVSVNVFQALQSESKVAIADPLRGSETIFQVVDDPEEAAKRLATSLVSRGVPYQFVVQPDGAFTLSFAATSETAKLLPGGQIVLPFGSQYVVSFEKSR